MKSTDTIEPEKRYPVNEIFCSLQGEGFFTGTPAVFVRFSGCNRQCDFCDTDFATSRLLTARQIVAEAAAYAPRHLVLTGGEPTMWIDDSLLEALKKEGFFVQIETNGSLPVSGLVDWVTCSPKAEPWAIGEIDELKIVYRANDDEVERIAAHFASARQRFLQPCSGLNIRETIDYVMSHPQWRLSLQTHKILDIR